MMNSNSLNINLSYVNIYESGRISIVKRAPALPPGAFEAVTGFICGNLCANGLSLSTFYPHYSTSFAEGVEPPLFEGGWRQPGGGVRG